MAFLIRDLPTGVPNDRISSLVVLSNLPPYQVICTTSSHPCDPSPAVFSYHTPFNVHSLKYLLVFLISLFHGPSSLTNVMFWTISTLIIIHNTTLLTKENRIFLKAQLLQNRIDGLDFYMKFLCCSILSYLLKWCNCAKKL